MWRIDAARVNEWTEHWRAVNAPARSLTFEEVLAGWQSDSAFREFWTDGLRELPFAAYCWECPPVSNRRLSRPFECVFVSSPSLSPMAPEPRAFREHFRPRCEAVSFANLAGDAVLVAPCPPGPGSDYGHLARFVANAPERQQHALWRAVAEAARSRLDADPTWLSTAGHGVAWLHVRLDSRPKYYRHAEYMRA